jgi:ribose transport system substrate-binding protein
MRTSAPLRRRHARLLGAAGTVAALAVALAGCGDSGAADSGTTNPGPTTSGTSAASSSLADEVATLTKPLSAYPVPTDPIDGVSGLRGKVVYYIPVSSQAPAFGVTGTALTAAAKAAGMRVQICDGKGTPTAIAACISQATDAKAGAIVADSVAYALAAHAFDAARAADIPVVINNQLPDPTHPADKTLAYIQGGGTQMDQALATWVSLDSQGKANVLINQSVDGPSPAAYVAAAKKVYAHDCGGCKVTLNQVSSANFSLVPSSTSAALLKDSGIGYVESQFEQYLQVTQAGIQQTGRTVKLVVGAAELGSLKAVANGTVAAAAGQADAYQGWVDLDAALRLMLGKTLPEYTIPVRLFTKDTMNDVSLDAHADATGGWFGPATFTTDFTKLWGLG